MHDIANMSKHAKLERHKSTFKELTVDEGRSLDHKNPPYVRVVMKSERCYNGIKMLDKIIKFWSDFYS